MLLDLKKGITYGPVHSRRLGRSLGINVLPGEAKLCTFDCLYCQYGWTGIHDAKPPRDVELPSVSDVLDAVRNALALMDVPPAYITFSGNGEPTLHPDFARMVEGVIDLRDRFSPQSETAILSNSTTATDPGVRSALARLDLRIMKLDSGTEEMLRTYNQPCGGIHLGEIVEGLAALKNVTIQGLFTGGSAGNGGTEAVDAWIDQLETIRPLMVQIYTLDRGYPSRRIEPLSKAELFEIAARLESKSIRAQVY
jgi:wyosine [tRNA(Phe)-imidazoG37] synthetase (radical SAM superfamily)